MKTHKILIGLIAIALLGWSDQSALFAQSKVGTTTAQFLTIPVGGEAIGLGGAYTAIANDASALYWNPGAVSRTGKNAVYASQTNWLVGSRHQWFGAKLMVTRQDAIGLSFNSLNYGARERVTTVDQPDGTGEYWNASDLSLNLTYCRNLTDRFSIGGSLKYINQQIWHESASGFAVDLGLLFITQFNGLRIAATLTNFGSELQLDGRDLLHRIDLDPQASGNNETIVARLKTDSWPIPLTFHVGAAMPIIRSNNMTVTLAADAVRPTDNTETLNVGGSVEIMKILSLRGGYQTLFRNDSQTGMTLGLGLRVPNPFADLKFDYAFQDFGLFGNIQSAGIGVSF